MARVAVLPGEPVSRTPLVMDHTSDELHMRDYNEKRRVLTSQSSGPVSSANGDGEKPAVRDLLVYYARHSTMHGIPSIVGSRLYRGRRSVWYRMCHLFLLGLCFFKVGFFWWVFFLRVQPGPVSSMSWVLIKHEYKINLMKAICF